ncbi:MAG: hypothetical protein GC185_13675 [Alphaproteobacteria bacterium]|nr:hypothetical protein [Alphaproteobacteria bacterium]
MRKTVLLLCLGFMLAIAPARAFACIDDMENDKKIAAYYGALRQECGDDGCCLASVQAMQQGGFAEAENGQCPEGVTRETMKCPGKALVWCEKPVYTPTDCLDGNIPAPPSGAAPQ